MNETIKTVEFKNKGGVVWAKIEYTDTMHQVWVRMGVERMLQYSKHATFEEALAAAQKWLADN